MTGGARAWVRTGAGVVVALAACTADPDPRPVVRISASALGGEGEVLRAQLAQFAAAHPDVRVEQHPTPDAADLRHQLYVQWLNADAERPDVLQLDVVWTAEFAAAGWILPLDRFGPDTAAFFPATIAANRWRDALYAVPWFVDVGMLYYRTDLVAPPTSYAELIDSAERARRDHGLDAGLIWQGARYEGLVTTYVEHLGAFGGEIVTADGAVAVDSPAAVRALEAMVDAVRRGVVPAAALAFHEEESRLWFQAGHGAFLRNWPYCRALLADPARSAVAGKVGITVMPAAPGGRPTAALGGAGLAINARARHPALAYELVAFLTAPAQARERAIAVGQYPARPAVYDDPALTAALGVAAGDVRRIVEAAVPRPVTPVYTELSSHLQIALHRALTGQATAADALAAAAAEIRDVLAAARLDVLDGRAPPPQAASAVPLAVTAVAIVAVVIATLIVVRRRRRGAVAVVGVEAAEVRLAWAFVTPALACIGLIAVFPLAWTAWESLHAHDLRLPWTGNPYVGADNYAAALGDDRFWAALGHTAMFSSIAVTLELGLGLVVALVLDRTFRGRGPVRVAVLIPWAIPTVVAALVWSFMFQPAGITNQALAWVGAVDQPIAWFNRALTAWAPVILADVWKTTPFVALLLLAGLQSIDRSLHEAAAVDGASKWQELWRVTLPLLRPAIVVAVLFRALDAFRVFDMIYVMTGGGPGTATEPLAAYAFTTLLDQLRFGYGAALSMLIFGGAFVISVVFVRGLGADLLREAR